MKDRISRFTELKPLPIQNPSIPEKARDVVYARKLLSVIGLDGDASPINAGAPIVGAAGMTMTLAVCPPGQGPGLHNHVKTYETFTVLKGRFEVRWNEDGSERAVLEQFDTISLPPGICRAFRNIGGEEGILQGRGRVEVGDLAPQEVGPGDVVLIPPSVRQRIANTGREDLVFLAICTPRFRNEAYEDRQ